MHTIETKNGKIKMKLPNYPQAMRLVGELGFSVGTEYNYYEGLAIISEKASEYVKEISIEGAKSYEDLLEDPKYSEEIDLILSAINERITEFSTAKKID